MFKPLTPSTVIWVPSLGAYGCIEAMLLLRLQPEVPRMTAVEMAKAVTNLRTTKISSEILL
jgi:hypothetical protein